MQESRRETKRLRDERSHEPPESRDEPRGGEALQTSGGLSPEPPSPRRRADCRQARRLSSAALQPEFRHLRCWLPAEPRAGLARSARSPPADKSLRSGLRSPSSSTAIAQPPLTAPPPGRERGRPARPPPVPPLLRVGWWQARPAEEAASEEPEASAPGAAPSLPFAEAKETISDSGRPHSGPLIGSRRAGRRLSLDQPLPIGGKEERRGERFVTQAQQLELARRRGPEGEAGGGGGGRRGEQRGARPKFSSAFARPPPLTGIAGTVATGGEKWLGRRVEVKDAALFAKAQLPKGAQRDFSDRAPEGVHPRPR
ncbi:UNVERIFIED_CONTAM: hypothetical protein K2H54_038657 [Gekko kuhli]